MYGELELYEGEYFEKAVEGVILKIKDIKYHSPFQKYIIKEEGHTINYNSLSFSLNYLPNLGKTNKKTFIVYVLSLTNVLGQDQVYGYNFSSMNNNKTAIIPPSKRFLYLGCFISFAVKRNSGFNF